MGSGRYNLQLDHCIGQQPQCPSGMAWRRCRTAQGHEVGLRLAVEERLVRGAFLLFAGEGSLQALFHKAFSNAGNGAGVHGERAGNGRIPPGGSVGIRFEEHVDMLNLGGRRFALVYQGLELLAFLFGQTDEVFLVHWDSLPHESFAHEAQR
jgi:hypothetical protein